MQVTVVDRTGVAAGSSWGNAGWLTPALTMPRPEQAVLAFGLRLMFTPSAPLYIPLSLDARLGQFLAQFALNCTRLPAGLEGVLPVEE